ncbi:MAG TPA: hypothetical protein VER55_00280, partial [Ardenticatenaceae bacterium]|nr:hypothetical protein [Ardenticatenaceae bacterium]
ASTGDAERATAAFRDANTTLVQRLVPALSGLENVKLESMEEAYARTSAQIRRWTGSFALAAAVAVAVLLAALALTRLWLHYRWTWQLLLAFLVGALLFGWFSYTLLSAANQVRVLVREAYDTVSGIQSVKALATQADALESLALFDSDQAQATLRDYDQYIFVIEQQLCGERDCSERPFLAPSGPVRRTEIEAVDPLVVEAAREGQSKYGLPRTPLIGNVHFRGEAAALEAVRVGLDQYLDANEDLRAAVLAGDVERATTINQGESATALAAMLEAADDERRLVRAEFNRIWNQVRGRMSVNLWLTLLFAAAAALGAWGISVRRQSLFP